MESESVLISREKSPLLEKKFPQRSIEPMMLHQAKQRAQHTTNKLFRPPLDSTNYITADTKLQYSRDDMVDDDGVGGTEKWMQLGRNLPKLHLLCVKYLHGEEQSRLHSNRHLWERTQSTNTHKHTKRQLNTKWWHLLHSVSWWNDYNKAIYSNYDC